MVTGTTRDHHHYFRSAYDRSLLQSLILKACKRDGWCIEEWSVFSNHYHFLAEANTHAPPNLPRLVNRIHRESELQINRRDQIDKRGIWQDYHISRAQTPTAYWNRKTYIRNNPAHHGLVKLSHQYPWCSSGYAR